jgi:hypothetical protein
MADPGSPLRNQLTPEDAVDFQLLSNTTAETICAMTGKSMDFVAKRASELAIDLKGTLAGSMKSNS